MKTIGAIALVSAMPIGFNFYWNHNVDYYLSGSKRVIKKIDGILSHTEVEIEDDGGIIMRKYISNVINREYKDEGGDGNLDRIRLMPEFLARGPESEFRDYSREPKKYYTYNGTLETNPEVFENAEYEYREQLGRFNIFYPIP